MPFSPLKECLDDLRAGKMVILTDDEDRENEGDLVLAAQFVTPETINFMLSIARGYLCLSLTEADCQRLDLHPQTAINTSARSTPFTVSIDGHPKHNFTTGVSARERARTIQLAINPTSGPSDFVRPGHINPLRARDGGVLVRTGQTEGSIDLCKLAGLTPAAVIIEIMRPDGEMARLPDLIQIAREHSLKICSVAQIIRHRLAKESLVQRIEPIRGELLHTRLGDFRLFAFSSIVDPLPHIALCVGDVGILDPSGQPIQHADAPPVLVRMHRRHLLGDVFGDLNSSKSASGQPISSSGVLERSMQRLQEEARQGRGGALIYLRPTAPDDTEGWGTSALEQHLQTPIRPLSDGIHAHEAAQSFQHLPGENPHAMRDYGVGVQILRLMGLHRIRLLTNSTAQLPALEGFGIEIVSREPI